MYRKRARGEANNNSTNKINAKKNRLKSRQLFILIKKEKRSKKKHPHSLPFGWLGWNGTENAENIRTFAPRESTIFSTSIYTLRTT